MIGIEIEIKMRLNWGDAFIWFRTGRLLCIDGEHGLLFRGKNVNYKCPGKYLVQGRCSK
jgi:hypothetical protein